MCSTYSLVVKRALSMGRFAWRRCSSRSDPSIRMTSVHTLCPCSPHSPYKHLQSLQGDFSSRTFSGSVCKQKSKSHHPGHDDGDGDKEERSDEDEEDFIKDEEVEELFQQHRPAGIGEEDHRVFIVHPDVKWGQKKQYLTTGNSHNMSVRSLCI